MEKRKIAVVGSRTFPLPQFIYSNLLSRSQDENPSEEDRESALETLKAAEEMGQSIVKDFIDQLSPYQHVVVSGGAKGVDSWAAEFAEERGIRVVVIRPNWKKYGKGAGFKRNKEIVLGADDVVAFWDGQSRGTLDTIRKAHKLRRPYALFGPDGQLKLAVTEEAYEAAEGEQPEFAIPKGRP